MGMFRSVSVRLPCEKCGRLENRSVQFKTGDDGLEEYALGQRLPKNDSLAAMTRHDGSAERFCSACKNAFDVDEVETNVLAYVKLVESGRLEVRRGKKTVTAQQLTAIARRQAKLEARGQRFGWHDDELRDCSFRWDGFNTDWAGRKFGSKKRDSSFEAEMDMRDEHNAMQAALMRERGWKAGRNQFRDLEVCVSAGRRMYVRELEPRE